MQPEPPRETSIKVAIRSSRRLFRDALVSWLTGQAEFTIVGHVSTDDDLLQLCALLGPELVLFDAGSAVPAALISLRALRDRFNQIRVVFVYDRLRPAELTAARRIGVETLVPCSHGLPALLTVLREEADRIRAARAGPATADGRLTEREREIIALAGAGHTVQRIAELLLTTPCAVENSKRRIYHKLGVVSQSQAIVRAAALGLVDPPPPGPAGSARTGSGRPGSGPDGAGRAAGNGGPVTGPGAEPATGPGGPSRTRVPAREPGDRLPQLTSREADILRSIAMGHTVRQTARLLAIAEKTVENTQARLFLKLRTRNRAGAIGAAHGLGLLDLLSDGEGPTPGGKQ